MPRDVEPIETALRDTAALSLAESGLTAFLFSIAMAVLAAGGMFLAANAADDYARFAGLAFAGFSSVITVRYFAR